MLVFLATVVPVVAAALIPSIGIPKRQSQKQHSRHQLVEVMIRDYCADHGMAVPDQQALFANAAKTSSQTE